MNPQAYQALRERAAWIDLNGRGKIRVTGEDRVRLMHAMCTNHIQDLQPGTGCYAFFLTAQGRILADAHIFCMPDYLLIDCEPDSRQRLMEHLDKYIIADDVTLHDFTDATTTINIEGPASEQILNDLGALPAHIQCSLVEWGHRQVARWSYTGGAGYSVFVPDDEREAFLTQLAGAGVPQAEIAVADVVRLENGRPRYGIDFSEANIPQETQQMHAVHFSKGCYLGQEIVERVRSRGHANRVLSSVELENGATPERGTKVVADGKEVGEILEAAFSPARGKTVGLAVIRAEALNAPLEAGGARLTVTKR